MKASRIIRVIAVVVSLLCIAFVGYTLFFKTPAINATHDMKIAIDTNPTQDEIDGLPEGAIKDFAALYAINNEVIGWLTIPNTAVDTVVVQSPEGTSPTVDKYLHGTNWQGNYYYYGAVFADARLAIKKDSGPDNTIIYGHNMYPIDDKLFFTRLVDYENFEFYKQNPIIQFSTLYEKANYKIFAIMYVNTDESDGEVFNYISNEYVNFVTEEDFNTYYNSIIERNLIVNDVDVKYGDKILTLSTCENRYLKTSRLVIFARKVREGEDAAVNVQNASINENVRMPEAWVSKGYGRLMK